METHPTEQAATALAWQRAYAGQRPGTSSRVNTLRQYDRAVSDALAAWRKWQAPPAFEISNIQEQIWYEVLERARVETLASLDLPGIAQNLRNVEALLPAGEALSRLYRVARAVFVGEETAGPILPEFPGLERASIKPKSGVLTRLRSKFQHPSSIAPESPRAESGMSEQNALALLSSVRSFLREPEQFSLTVQPLVQWLVKHIPPDTSEEVGSNPQLPINIEVKTDQSLQEEDEAGREIPGEPLAEETIRRDWPGYAVYTTKWDEIRTAASFYPAGEIPALHELSGLRREQVRRLAHRLQRRLMEARLRTWSYDQEEGRLDSRRLARLLLPRNGQAVFRQESEIPLPDACVTLLVDQSGSMHGKRREMAALAIDLAIHTLENCRISTEVLAYTTRYGTESPLVADWQRSGAQPMPGRLNALRHIVYKEANRPWRRCRPYLELLLRDGFGKENIDGEALDWAARRLANRPEPRKILIVLSDGSPYDAATSQAYERNYLEDHLRQVIVAIEASPIHLSAIGTGQDVGRFYRHALTLDSPDEVAERLFEYLGELLVAPSAERQNL